MPPKKPKQQQQPDDQFLNLIGPQLQSSLILFKQKQHNIKAKRNYQQVQRDIVQQRYHNVLRQISQKQQLIGYQSNKCQNLIMQHNKCIKVFLGRLKLSQHQQQKQNISIAHDGQQQKLKQHNDNEDSLNKATKIKNETKHKQLYQQKINVIQSSNLSHNYSINNIHTLQSIQNNLITIQNHYQAKLSQIKQQLKLISKIDIHSLQQRKNLHINQLIRNHQSSFQQLRQYYNQLTKHNIKLIKNHKTDIQQINKQLQINNIKIAQLKQQNSLLKQPLLNAKIQKDKLKSLLKQFDQHKLSLQNYKTRYSNLRQRVIKLSKQFINLTFIYDKTISDKKSLNSKFDTLTKQVKKHTQMYNVMLITKMQTQIQQLHQKQSSLHQLIKNSSLPSDTVSQIKLKVKQSIQNKNNIIKSLKYSIHHATKAYNDAIRVFQSKLVQFGIPSYELGFQPLQTITSSVPAGLVAS